MSRIGVGLFALLLVGGVAAFFTGLLDPALGRKPEAVKSVAFTPKPKSAAPINTPPQVPKPSTPTTTETTQAPLIASLAPQAASAPVKTTVTQAPAATINNAEIAPPPAVSINKTNPVHTVTQPSRSRDLDLRKCLELGSDMDIAQCAYRLQ